MASLPTPFDPYNPIPNSPFYSPETNYLQGPLGPLVLGSGLSVSSLGVISSSGGSGGGTVTSITAGLGLAGGNITGSGTISIAPSGVIAGSYTFPALSVNAQGQITSINSGFPVLVVAANAPLIVTGTPQLPTLSIAQASITQVGATQLNNTTSSTLTNQALTAAAGKNLQDQINSLAQNANGLTLAGTLNAATGLVVTATTPGITAGITAGNVLPTPTPALNSFYLIVTTASLSYTPTGSPAISNVLVGDYIICSSGVWTILRVGPITGAYATTTTAGVVELATSAEAIAGVNPNTVLTPATGSVTYIPKNIITAQGQLIAGTGSGTFTALGVGVDGYVLSADSSCAAGVKWAPGGGGSASVSITGLAPVYVTPSPLTGVGAVGIDNASTTQLGAVQLADAAATQAGTSTALAVTPAAGAAAYVLASAIGAKGELFVGLANDSVGILPVGTDNQTLVACAACTQGITWRTGSPLATPTVSGAMYGIPWNATLNTSVGCQALLSVSSGQGNTALGYGAGALISTGNENVAVGTAALAAETTGARNTALGTGALCAQNGASDNTAIGYGAGNSLTTGLRNTIVGSLAGDNVTTGYNNNFFGYGAGAGVTSGAMNVLIGCVAGCAIIAANGNTMVGNIAGCSTTGDNNTFIGSEAGTSTSTGSNNVFIGKGVAANSTTGNCNVVIGYLGGLSIPSVSNEVSIWGGSTVARFSQGSGSWTFTSDARKKENVADLALGLDFVNKVQPRTFDWKEDGQHSAGFIAQELDAVVEEFNADYLGVVSKADPNSYSVAQAALIPVLVNAIKELAAEVAELKAKLG